jgi:hypothetical protein
MVVVAAAQLDHELGDEPLHERHRVVVAPLLRALGGVETLPQDRVALRLGRKKPRWEGSVRRVRHHHHAARGAGRLRPDPRRHGPQPTTGTPACLAGDQGDARPVGQVQVRRRVEQEDVTRRSYGEVPGVGVAQRVRAAGGCRPHRLVGLVRISRTASAMLGGCCRCDGNVANGKRGRPARSSPAARAITSRRLRGRNPMTSGIPAGQVCMGVGPEQEQQVRRA